MVSAKQAGEDRLEDYSNAGRDYSDIVADGSGLGSDFDGGTSYAAPRVSRVAALLAQEFPALSVEQIRASILLGARVPYEISWNSFVVPRFLPTRSGGILDEKATRKVAQHIHDTQLAQPMTFEIASEILNRLACSDSVTTQACQLAKLKLDWMKGSQAFPL